MITFVLTDIHFCTCRNWVKQTECTFKIVFKYTAEIAKQSKVLITVFLYYYVLRDSFVFLTDSLTEWILRNRILIRIIFVIKWFFLGIIKQCCTFSNSIPARDSMWFTAHLVPFAGFKIKTYIRNETRRRVLENEYSDSQQVTFLGIAIVAMFHQDLRQSGRTKRDPAINARIEKFHRELFNEYSRILKRILQLDEGV